MSATERFLKYISVYTTSQEDTGEQPSTARQLNLSRRLEEEMTQMGLKDVHIDACGNVIATLPATEGIFAPVLALIAHVDTAPAAPGENVKARIVEYTGGDIPLSEGIVMRADKFPCLQENIGKHLIVTDGTTLLGADDKAGVAEILTAAEYLMERKLPHGELRLVFTTDEEIGCGTEGLDVKELACDFGYTVDGGELKYYEYENFNAASAKIHVNGVSIHTGDAKGIMKNAAAIACRLHSMLPPEQVPEKTEGYEGFFHLDGLKGDVNSADMGYIIRDHDWDLFQAKKALMTEVVNKINAEYGEGTAELKLKDTYYNMRQKVEPHKHLLDKIEQAFAAHGVAITPTPIRGGTDGATLTWQGLPCPNLPTGGYNFHGVYEFIPQEALELMPEILVTLVQSFLI